MKRIILSIIVITIFLSCKNNVETAQLKLWYDKPAENWNEALPIGNGRLGAMVFGKPELEKLQLNEETVWAGGPHNNVNIESKKWLPIVREMFFKGEYEKAHNTANNNIVNPVNGMPYQPVGDLLVRFEGHENFTNYNRELDIKQAISTVTYNVNGVTFKRETFASFTDQVIIMQVSANQPGMINCNLAMESPQKHNTLISDNQIVLNGITSDHEGIEGKVRFQTIIKPVLEKGELHSTDSTLQIRNADKLTIYISIGTNFINYKDISGDLAMVSKQYMDKALSKDFTIAKQDHITFYQNYFNRVSFDLGTTDSINKPTDQRLKDFKLGDDPQLVTLFFQYGRYLLISSSQPGGQPANLQGIWNPHMNPPWESKYTVNINCEMNYWPAEVCNLSELNEPLFGMIKDLSVTGQESAQKLYDARGWMLHHNTDIWRVTGIFDRATYGLWQSGGGWLSQHLWQHYLYSGDKKFLKEVYPILKGAALFYMDELIEEPRTGYMVIGPSNSPENKFMDLCAVSAGTTMDNQIIFDVFNNLITASEILETEEIFIDTLKTKLSQLPPMQIGQYGQLQEWLFDWDAPYDHHRHVSHLYGVYPSNQISPYHTPTLFKAAKQSLLYRGDESTGWSMGWKVNLWARFLDGDHALKLITAQLSPAVVPDLEKEQGGTYPNLLDAHPPFQIDGNFGCTAGIAEMLMQSHNGSVHILPALPSKWTKGEITGLKARGGFEVDISWNNGKVAQVKIHSKIGGNLRIRSADQLTDYSGNELPALKSENTNILFKLNQIKQPVISENIDTKRDLISKTFLYDIPTEAGKTYKFKLAKY